MTQPAHASPSASDIPGSITPNQFSASCSAARTEWRDGVMRGSKTSISGTPSKLSRLEAQPALAYC